MLDVTVVIPNLNGESVLGECLEALPEASKGLDCKAVVVDNASTDCSRELVRDRLPDTVLITNAQNLGFAVACNQGGRALESRHVLLLNSDVCLSPESLTRMVARLDAHPTLGAVSPRLFWPDGRVQGPRLPLFARARGGAVTMPFLPGTCLLLRREALDRVDWLDEGFFFYNEDLDLSWRLRKAGWTLECLRDVAATHQEGTATRSQPEVRARAIAEGYGGSVRLTRKHHPWATGIVRAALRGELLAHRLRLGALARLGSRLSERDQALALSLPMAHAALDRSRGR